jgi:hypothetical protein
MVEIKASYSKTPDYIISTDFPENTFISGDIYKQSAMNTKLMEMAGATITLSDGTTSAQATTVINDILGAGIGKSRVIKYTDGTSIKFYKFTKVSNNDGVTNVSFEDNTGYAYLKLRA